VQLAADSGQLTTICLLDLTATFDTVDHDLLLLRLQRQFDLRGVVLQWFRSYLAGRSFRVLYCNQALGQGREYTSALAYLV